MTFKASSKVVLPARLMCKLLEDAGVRITPVILNERLVALDFSHKTSKNTITSYSSEFTNTQVKRKFLMVLLYRRCVTKYFNQSEIGKKINADLQKSNHE